MSQQSSKTVETGEATGAETSSLENQDLEDRAQLEIDRRDEDVDSAYGDEVSTYTASLTESCKDFKTENGRQYHSFREGTYYAPNDEKELESLDIHHALMLALLDGKLHWAPIDPNPQRVLDIGTGTGIWAIDFADLYPSAMVIGNDLSPTQPTSVPPNVKFVVDDIEDEWGYESQPFDYIHSRFLVASIRDWPRLVRQAFNCTRSGGWVEFQDWDTMIYSTDGSITEDHFLKKWHNHACGRGTAAGYSTQPGPELERWLKAAGFINVTAHRLPMPLGVWPKDRKYKRIGAFNMAQYQERIDGTTIGVLMRLPGPDPPWSMEEVQVLLARTKADLRDPKIHGQYDFYVVYGQKPPPQGR